MGYSPTSQFSSLVSCAVTTMPNWLMIGLERWVEDQRVLLFYAYMVMWQTFWLWIMGVRSNLIVIWRLQVALGEERNWAGTGSTSSTEEKRTTPPKLLWWHILLSLKGKKGITYFVGKKLKEQLHGWFLSNGQAGFRHLMEQDSALLVSEVCPCRRNNTGENPWA